MKHTILNALMLYSGAGFIFYRAWVLRDFSKCLPATMIVILALAAWPFFAPMKTCIISAYVIALIFLPFLKVKGFLKKKSVIWAYSVLAIVGLTYMLVTILLPNLG